MGSCLSKDKPAYKGSTRPIGTQTSSNRAGGANKKPQNSSGAGQKLGTANAKTKQQSTPFAGQGRALSDSNNSGAVLNPSAETNTENPREAAARAAQVS